MADIFRSLFFCCIRTRNELTEQPNERTHLLPPPEDIPPARSYIADPQKMKERMGTIVRAKEGRMVNVNAPLPFNIHNKSQHRLDGRSDRSLSTRRDPSYPGASTSRAQPGSPTVPVFQHASSARMPSYSRSRDPSPSIQTSHSTSSLHPGDASYLPPEVDPEGGPRGPLFNVRIVRGAGGFGIGNGKLRQGRNSYRGRLGRFSEDRGRSLSQASDASGTATKDGRRISYTLDDDVPEPDREPAPEQDALQDGNEPSPREDDVRREPEATAHVLDFKIQDVGKITESWGD
ncbi:hypothetical protein CERSUDRAFT_117903 [Gelatoporia subvermispora B]|uniref:Uncharacterized protein n=1 Tax=Ceriporiopsis subvermispora (strain B) TaxID=914234 RepID=M2QA86_CERS8|nr:hypothetical protein CERSUDRAFT_117903 [Gelatoporia subvermispora B]